jgi:hypothetical protein
MTQSNEAGDALPQGTAVIEVYIADASRIFHAIDPSPFRDKDLDPNAEEFIVAWSRELPRDAPLGLRITLEHSADLSGDALLLREAIQRFFAHRSEASARRLRHLFEVGRTSLAIGLVVLVSLFAVAELTARALRWNAFGVLLREGLLIGGWVAMWRPLEIFLYDWWPIRAEQRLFDRLAGMPVRVRRADATAAREGA